MMTMSEGTEFRRSSSLQKVLLGRATLEVAADDSGKGVPFSQPEWKKALSCPNSDANLLWIGVSHPVRASWN